MFILQFISGVQAVLRLLYEDMNPWKMILMYEYDFPSMNKT